jgi:23S rRNA (adenine2503-C2)-methyltransferase
MNFQGKKSILFAAPRDLEAVLLKTGFEKYRLEQINDWIYKKYIISFREMRNLPAQLIEVLDSHFFIINSEIIKRDADNNGTTKLLFKFFDGECVESVVIPSPGRLTFCLSSQSGCPVGCIFCASAADGFSRNLLSSEITDEFLLCRKERGITPSNIVFMGVGEPLMNYDNLLNALNTICAGDKFAVSPRRITISTSGYVPGMIKLAGEARPWNLALSLHSTDDKERKKLMPNLKFNLSQILNACVEYKNKTGRIVTLEWLLLDNFNSSETHAAKLASVAKKLGAKINLIPFNPHKNANFKRPTEEQIKKFEKILEQYRVKFTRRIEKGNIINAACGQLRAQHCGK